MFVSVLIKKEVFIKGFTCNQMLQTFQTFIVIPDLHLKSG